MRSPNGEISYTRAGSFHLDRDGNMVTSDGDPLDPNHHSAGRSEHRGGHGRHGELHPAGPDQRADRRQIQLALFQNPAGLNSMGRNLYMPTDASGEPIIGNPGGQEGIGSLLQGYTEQSNVSVVEEFIGLIVAQRAYEANSKVVKAADEMYSQGQQPDAMMLLLAAALAACVPVDGERIGAADLPPPIPLSSRCPRCFAGLRAGPGAHRSLSASELGALAARYGIARQGAGSVCFQRRTHVLTPESIAAAMRATRAPRRRSRFWITCAPPCP